MYVNTTSPFYTPINYKINAHLVNDYVFSASLSIQRSTYVMEHSSVPFVRPHM